MNLSFENEEYDSLCIMDLHYRFADDGHIMDALVQNKCERAFLALVQSISKTARVQVTVEIEPHLEGGLINRYRILAKINGKKSKMPESVKIALLTAIFLAPTTIVINGINEIVKSVVSERFKDPVMDSMNKDKLSLEIEKLHLEISEKKQINPDDKQHERKKHNDSVTVAIEDFRGILIKVDAKKSANACRLKFYKELAKYNKISSVSTQVINAGYLPKTQEFQVDKNEFISVATDMASDLKRLERARRFFGDDSDVVLEIKRKISKSIDGAKHNK